MDEIIPWAETARAYAMSELAEADAARGHARRERRAGHPREARVQERQAAALERAASMQQAIADELHAQIRRSDAGTKALPGERAEPE